MVALRFRRDELNTDITDLNRRLNDERPDINREKLKTVSNLLRGQLDSGDHKFRQAYARLLLDEVRVSGSGNPRHRFEKAPCKKGL